MVSHRNVFMFCREGSSCRSEDRRRTLKCTTSQHLPVKMTAIKLNVDSLRVSVDGKMSLHSFFKYILSFRVFGLLSSSLQLYSQRFGRYVLRSSSNSGTYTELRTTFFIESMGVACFDSVNHNRVQVLRIPVLLLASSQDLTSNL